MILRRVTVVVGTRPECIKLAPLVQQLRQRNVPVTVIHTGQHQDLWKGSGLEPDVMLPPLSDEDLMMAIRVQLGPSTVPVNSIVLNWDEVIVVQGDTRTAYFAACAAGLENPIYRVIHVEAGIRSGNFQHPYPEEDYRTVIDRASFAHFCATEENLENLKAEGLGERAWVTGNTGVDACMARQRHVPYHDRHNTVLVTLHRRESFGEPMAAIARGLYRVAREHPEIAFHCPLHPNNAFRDAMIRLYEEEEGYDGLPPNIKLGPPLAYPTFLNKLAHCQAVLTDSGGVQEDACTLGIPAVIAREVTDRPESVASGHAIVCGRTEQGVEVGLYRALGGLLRADPGVVFGDGQASERIADLLIQHVLQRQAAAA